MRRVRRTAAIAALAIGQSIGIVGGIVFAVGLVGSIVPLAMGEWVAGKLLDTDDPEDEEVWRGFDS